MLDQPVEGPHALEAQDCFAELAALEPVVAEAEGEGLERDQLRDVAHVWVFLGDDFQRAVEVAELLEGVELENHSPPACIRGQRRFELRVVIGGLLEFPLEDVGGADRGACLADSTGGGVLAHIEAVFFRACREESDELLQGLARGGVVFFLKFGDAEPEAEILPLGVGQFGLGIRRLFFEGGFDRLQGAGEIRHLHLADRDRIKRVETRLGGLGGGTIVDLELLVGFERGFVVLFLEGFFRLRKKLVSCPASLGHRRWSGGGFFIIRGKRTRCHHDGSTNCEDSMAAIKHGLVGKTGAFALPLK